MSTRIVVPYAFGAAGPLEIVRAAAGTWDVTFVYSSRDPHSRTLAELMASVGDAIDVNGSSYARIVRRLRGTVAGVVTFSESMIQTAGRLASDLRCLTNAPDTIEALTDKVSQRRRLNAAGVTPIRATEVKRSSWRQSSEIVGFPAVIKRTRSSAGRVHVVTCIAELQRHVRASAGPILMEELLLGRPRDDEPWLGDYVSVESVVSHGQVRHFCVTDKLPLAPDFLEVGSLLPSTLDDEMAQRVRDCAERAVHALGIRTGAVHTEIKLTPNGPRIVEVNGRLGAFVPRLVSRASDLNPARLAMSIAVGASEHSVPAYGRQVGTVYVVAPARARRVIRVAPAEQLRALPGVWGLHQHRKPGDELRADEFPRIQTIDIEGETRVELTCRMYTVLAHAYAAFMCR